MVEIPDTVTIRRFVKSMLQRLNNIKAGASGSAARNPVRGKSELGLKKQDQRIRKGEAFLAMLTVK